MQRLDLFKFQITYIYTLLIAIKIYIVFELSAAASNELTMVEVIRIVFMLYANGETGYIGFENTYLCSCVV